MYIQRNINRKWEGLESTHILPASLLPPHRHIPQDEEGEWLITMNLAELVGI